MELSTVLWIISGTSFIVFLILIKLGQQREKMDAGSSFAEAESGTSTLSWFRSFRNGLLLRSYIFAMRFVPTRYFLLKIRGRMAVMQVYEEASLRIQSMEMLYLLTGITSGTIAAVMLMNPGVMFALTSIIVSVVIQGLILDIRVNRLEIKLLDELLSLMSSVRHAYQRHGMVSDALEEAADQSKEPVSIHAGFILDALTDSKPSEALEQYFETAPNRFLKAFAGISQLIMEFGDQNREKGSLYLRGLGNLSGEIQLDLLRRNRLDYLLKGLSVIALLPVFFTKPVEQWAIRSFPLTEQFYLSKPGMLVKIGLLLIILACSMLLQKLKGEEDSAYRQRERRAPWEARWYRRSWVSKIARCFTPLPGSRYRERLNRLLKDNNHPLSLEWFQLRRVTLFVLCMALAIGGAFWMHWKSKQWIVNEPPASYVFFGSLSSQDREAAESSVALDKTILGLKDIRTSREKLNEAILQVQTEESGPFAASDQRIDAVQSRILDKLHRLDNEYLKWWELLAAAGAGLFGYYVPYWMLILERRIRLMDMKNEVYQFQTMIFILRELDRISVEEILEWMYSYAVLFKDPLQKCLLHFGHGAESALLQMKEEAGLEEFRQLADKLILANEKITIYSAFDDLESDMSFQFEQRRLHFEKSLELKAELGRMFGFAPMYSLIFGYLVIPLIWMSFEQMGIYFEQIQHL